MRSAAAARGIELLSIARQLTAQDLASFDLILTMDQDNLEQTRRLDPTGRFHGRINPLAPYCRRHQVREIPDPYEGGRDGFEHVLDLLEDACQELLNQLASHPRG
jgi:protein-tyrosine phosphatase